MRLLLTESHGSAPARPRWAKSSARTSKNLPSVISGGRAERRRRMSRARRQKAAQIPRVAAWMTQSTSLACVLEGIVNP